MRHELFGDLVRYVFGPDAEERDWNDFAENVERATLKGTVAMLTEEADAVNEAGMVLGGEENFGWAEQGKVHYCGDKA